MLRCSLEKGTTYNAYIIYGEQYTALVDTSHEKFTKLFMSTLKQELAKAGRKVDYLFVSSDVLLVVRPLAVLSCRQYVYSCCRGPGTWSGLGAAAMVQWQQ